MYLNRLANQVKDLSGQGRFSEALALQIEILNETKRKRTLQDFKKAAWLAWNAGDFEPCLVLLRDALPLASESERSNLKENIAACLSRMQRHEEARAACLELLEEGHKGINLYDVLTSACGALRRFEEVRTYGNLTLEWKDRQADTPGLPLPGRRPVYSPQGHNVITFSLWGNNPRYLRGAVRNALLVQDVYPGWRVRFYLDTSVPQDVVGLLRELKSELRFQPHHGHPFEGLAWRFQVLDDPEVDFFLVRDCDSVLSSLEFLAVSQWLASDRWFHIMRCWPSHTDLILAGMWGGAQGALPGVPARFPQFLQTSPRVPTNLLDQEFLRACVWPTVKQSSLIHDRFFTAFGALPFPGTELMPPHFHVGVNECAVRNQYQELVLRPYARVCPSLRLPV